MKKILVLVLVVTLISSAFTFTSTAQVNTTDIMGTPVVNPAYVLDVEAPAYYDAGDTIFVTLTLNDITAANGYSLLKFLLYYDATKVEPVVLNSADNAEMDNFLVTAPDINKWEGVCKLETETSRYDISFMTTNAASVAKTDGSVVIQIPFLIKEIATSDIIFQVPHASTSCVDYNLSNFYGNGGTATTRNIAGIMGDEVTQPKYVLAVSAAENYAPGHTVEITVTLNNITASTGYGLVHFFLYYNSDLVEPVVKNDGENEAMGDFLVTAPNKSDWEGICRLDEENAKYDLSYMTTKADSTAKTNGSFVVKISFLVKENAEDDLFFLIPHAETVCTDYNMVSCYGNGGSVKMNMTTFVPFEPVDGSTLEVNEEDGFLEGVEGGLTTEQLLDQFQGDLTIFNREGGVAGEDDVIGTGFVISNGQQEITVVVLGDGNGDGQANARDFLLAKRAFLGTFTLAGAELTALCIGGGSRPTAMDYLKIKRHFLGTYDLYA